MHETAVRADKFGKMGEEGDDVVLGDGFDFIDAGDVEGGAAALFPDRLGRRFRNDAEVGQCVTGMCLDLEPDAELCFRRPDGDHFRPGVTRDHGNDFLCGGILLPV
ncbi:hypothetical protein D3C72_1782910 [compost metagenome]